MLWIQSNNTYVVQEQKHAKSVPTCSVCFTPQIQRYNTHVMHITRRIGANFMAHVSFEHNYETMMITLWTCDTHVDTTRLLY